MNRGTFNKLNQGVYRLMLVCVVLVGVHGGCARTVVSDPLDTTAAVGLAGDDAVIAELDFFDSLATRPVVTNDEGLYALVLYAAAGTEERAEAGAAASVPSVDATAGDTMSGEAEEEGPTERRRGVYEQRVAEAKRRRWLDDSWNEPSNLAMQRGTLARALAVVCEVRGGVMMRLVGPSERYASRELANLGILSPGSEQQTMTGAELISILSKAQDYQLLEAVRREKEAASKAAKNDAGSRAR